MQQKYLKKCYFRPYRKNMGPTFTLITYALGYDYSHGKERIGYSLSMHENKKTIEVFNGNDFFCSPSHAIDSNECIKTLMGFLTLRQGDTDQEYFDDYSLIQLDYRDNHAEALSMTVCDRFGYED